MTAPMPASWINCPRPKPSASVRLYCFPPAGGASSTFFAWTAALADVEVCPIELPGRGSRIGEYPFTQLERLVDALVPALRGELDRPYALFGHSMGGLIAFETARRLRALGAPLPQRLCVAAVSAPQVLRHGG